jgi:para-nitrobenzyl esterase
MSDKDADKNIIPGVVVETSGGKVRGTVHNGIHAFKGIQYGASTGGKMRFMAPGKPTSWKGVRDAFNFGHWSPQTMRYTEMLSPQADIKAEGMDEDCLYLNVWTPDPNSKRKRPVMFWCHGGGFRQESGTWPWVYGESLSRRGDVVVVTVNHRLNLFGYFHLSDIGGEKYAASGNAGMLDLVAGLQWVHNNAAAFGGDPDNVMIFGESGGGAKVCSLLAIPAAKGLFHRAAIQSGVALRLNTREQSNQLTHAMLKELEITSNRVDALQDIPVSTLLAAITKVVGTNADVQFSPVVDGKIIPTHPFSPGASPISASIPILVGCNRHEQTYTAISQNDEAAFNLDGAGLRQRVIDMVGGQDADSVIDLYHKVYPGEGASERYFLMGTDRRMRSGAIMLAERKFAQGNAPVYMYLFSWRSPVMDGKVGATHTVEIPFVFDNTDIPTVMTKGGPEVKELAAKTSEAWIRFAQTGNPNHPGLPDWPSYNTHERATMVFDNTCRVVNDPGGDERKLWEVIRSRR